MPSPALTPCRWCLFIPLSVVSLALSACGLIPQENTALLERSSFLQTAEATRGERRFGDARYTGELRGNQPDGEGTLEWDDGRRYQGQFSAGQMQGQGKLTLADGSAYQGPFKGDRPFGQGTLTLADGALLSGTFTGLEAASGTLTMADGSHLEGDFKDQQLHGTGTRTKANGESLSGQYRDGLAYGLMQLSNPGQPPRLQLWLGDERLIGHLENPADFGRDPQAMAREIITSHQWHASQLPEPILAQSLAYSAALLEDPQLAFTPEQQVEVLGNWPLLAGAMTTLPYQQRLKELAAEPDCGGFATAIALFPPRYLQHLQQACSDIARKQGASAADYAYLLDNQLITWGQLPQRKQPLLSGPPGARPVDLLAQLELGADASQLAELVSAGSTAYPLVSSNNQPLLQAAGVPFSLISAMQIANQRHLNEQEELRRYREEQQRINREIAEERRRQEELRAQMEWEEEQLRQAEFDAQYGSNASSGVNWLSVIEHAGQAMTELTQLQQQINQENRQMALEAQRIQNQRQAEALQRERQQAAERQQAMNRQQQAQQQQQREREAQQQRQREQQAARQRDMAQRMAELQSQQQAAMNRATPQTTATASGGVASSRGLQKVYEPNMERATGRSTAGFTSLEQTQELALLNGINQIHRACSAKGARVDSVPNDMLRNKTAPPRWHFGAPQCRQGGWQGKEWFCDTPVAGTCFRMQSFSSP